ncbi:MAG: hypothetical protein ACRDKT_17445 [Actinomycetota bacterium]
MSESVILLIAGGLLVVLIILLIVIARLLVGVRQTLAAARSAEAAAVADGTAEGTAAPIETAAAAEVSEQAAAVPIETGPVDVLLMEQSQAAEATPIQAPEQTEAVPIQASEQTEAVPIEEPHGLEAPPVEPAEPVEPAPIEAAHETPEVVTSVGATEPEMTIEPESVEATPSRADVYTTTAATDQGADPGADPFADTSFADDVSDQVPEPAEPQPYQRDGRWWFERDGELLVYDDVKGEWIPAGAEGSESLEQAVETPDETVSDEPRETSEPVAAATSTFTESPSDAAAAQEPGSDVDAENVPEQATTSPWAEPRQADPFTHPLDEPRPEYEPAATAPAEETPAPTEEPVGAEVAAPVEETPTTEAAPVEEAPQPASYWKCPSCGVVNGSTATSCRMCFTARP